MAVAAARQEGLLGREEAEVRFATLERADRVEAIEALVVPDVDVSCLLRPDAVAWQEEIRRLSQTYLEPGAADWYGGMAQPDHLLVVWMCRDVARHARELRRRISQPYRLRCAAAGVPLAPLREVEEALWDIADDAVTGWGIDLERNSVVVTTDRDVSALAARLRARFGGLVTVEHGHAAQI